jgi:hypothetical protein
MITKIEASALALKALKAFWAADRANVYINPRDIYFTVNARLPRYVGSYLRFTPVWGGTAGKLNAFGRRDENGRVICDGATAAPDWPRGVRPATGLHDPGYLEMERIAEAWKNEPFDPGYKRDWIAKIGARGSKTWTKSDVRQLLDMMFGGTIKAGGGRPRVQRLYYTGVRLVGDIAHLIGKRGAVLALCGATLCMGGCSGGCMSPPDDFIEWPDGPPELEQVEGGDLGGDLGEIFKEAAGK